MEIHKEATQHMKKEEGDMVKFVEVTEKMSDAARSSREYLFERLFSREVVLHAEEQLSRLEVNRKKIEEK